MHVCLYIDAVDFFSQLNNIQGERGFSQKINIVDEFSFVKEETLLYNVFPLMAVQHRTLVVLTSPIDKESERMVILDKSSSKPPYEKHFDTLDFATVCDTCLDENPTVLVSESFFCSHRLGTFIFTREKGCGFWIWRLGRWGVIMARFGSCR